MGTHVSVLSGQASMYPVVESSARFAACLEELLTTRASSKATRGWTVMLTSTVPSLHALMPNNTQWQRDCLQNCSMRYGMVEHFCHMVIVVK